MSFPGPIPTPITDVARPWGGFRQYASNAACTVSLMTVQPGRRLSLQSHRDRSELWIVLDPGAVVRVGDLERPCAEGEEIWIPAGERHRLACAGDRPVRVLEVAFGDWRQEDIQRYEDDFGRPREGE